MIEQTYQRLAVELPLNLDLWCPRVQRFGERASGCQSQPCYVGVSDLSQVLAYLSAGG